MRRAPSNAPFPTKMIQDGTVKLWLEWCRVHGHAIRDTGDAEFLAYWNRVFEPWLAGQSSERKLAYVRELGFARDWAASGFQQVVVGDRLFASLAATRMPAEVVPDIGLPWDCFIVRVPDRFRVSMKGMHRENGENVAGYEDAIGYLRVRKCITTGRFVFSVIGEVLPWAGMHASFGSVGDLLVEHTRAAGDFKGNGFVAVGASEDWSSHRENLEIGDIMRRAVVGVVLEMMSPKSHRTTGLRTHAAGRGSMRPLAGVTTRLTRDVLVDCRDWVDAKLRGERARGPVGVQTFVEGYWRNQPCGPKQSLRRLVQVEPHWRGPADAPIAVRSHVLNASEKGAAE